MSTNQPSQSKPQKTPTFQAPYLLHTYSHLPDRSIRHDEWSSPPVLASASYSSSPSTQKDQRKISTRAAPPASLARYAGPPPIPSDLNTGFDTHIARDPEVDNVEYLDGVLESLLLYEKRRKGSASASGSKAGLKSPSIITWRGILTRLLILGNTTHNTNTNSNRAGSGSGSSGVHEDGWELHAQAFDGGVYLILRERGGKRGREEKEETLQILTFHKLTQRTDFSAFMFFARVVRESKFAKQAYHGYAFESFSTSPYTSPDSSSRSSSNSSDFDSSHHRSSRANTSKDGTRTRKDPPGWGGQVNTNVQWCCVVKSRIGGRNGNGGNGDGNANEKGNVGAGDGRSDGVALYYGGEVDCMEGDWPGRPYLNRCIELKTNMVLRDGRGRAGFERKLMKHWAQSFLLGIPTIEIGFRDHNGLLRSVERFNTLEIPKIVRKSTPPFQQPPWDTHACLTGMEGVCEWIVGRVLGSGSGEETGSRKDSTLADGKGEGDIGRKEDEDDTTEEGGYSPSRPNDGNDLEVEDDVEVEIGTNLHGRSRIDTMPADPRERLSARELFASPPKIWVITYDPSTRPNLTASSSSSKSSQSQPSPVSPHLTIRPLDLSSSSPDLVDVEYMRSDIQTDEGGNTGMDKGKGRWGFLLRSYVEGMIQLESGKGGGNGGDEAER